ncbi:MarR family winged helix-turn-helix transcriptional regulator [Kibdelosporangium philippinense]|uniref:MarR family winged helix-turn-helix transcriptional regulator n=1 Tax=Kibdelosporangium philippinense TaxID=211113 RepID=A0ABS8ZRR5_9PSEU|nr:MarR family winged helix-turn-helix transcriptional regulator [Kibdelosporangium philippinense]MCE7010416.1 MarR family winged helix-turn-helix transcriptional regulator [Kibdelosporangium philippinense]
MQHLQADFGLSAADYLIMANLADAPHSRMRTYELIEATRWEKSRLSHHLKRMERRRLVRRVPTDKLRSPAFMLTEDGEQVIAEAAPAHADRIRQLFFDAVDEEFLGRFVEMCETVLARIDRHGMGDIAPPGQSTVD